MRRERYDTVRHGAVPAISRRSAFGVLGAGALALLGAGGTSGALWTATDGLTSDPITAGNLDISQGRTDGYYFPIADNPGGDTLVFRRYPGSETGDHLLGSDGLGSVPMIWLTDLTVTNSGDNMIARLHPTADHDELSAAVVKSFGDSHAQTIADYYTAFRIGLWDRVDHEETITDVIDPDTGGPMMGETGIATWNFVPIFTDDGRVDIIHGFTRNPDYAGANPGVVPEDVVGISEGADEAERLYEKLRFPRDTTMDLTACLYSTNFQHVANLLVGRDGETTSPPFTVTWDLDQVRRSA